MKCPGQDSRYWTGDVMVEVPCPECGFSVEIFRDESFGRCRRCGHKFSNPGADFGCAKWCSLAKECLGFAPIGQKPTKSDNAYAVRLIQWAEQHFSGDAARLSRVFRAFQYAKELVRQEGGNPRIAVSAAILLASNAFRPDSPPEKRSEVEKLLDSADFEQDTLEQVRCIVSSCVCGEELDSIEFRIVRDANTLAGLLAEPFSASPEEWKNLIQSTLRTDAARNKALAQFCK
jgi:hypothetical protein